MSSPPVFIHSSFRVSSTWLWRHFRMAPGTIAYYEIFHERLAKLTMEGIDSFTTECWESRHPPSDPYFIEFRDLLNGECGVRRYDKSFAYELFVPDDGPQGDISPQEAKYVTSLIDFANMKAKIPVLTCSRSLGRATGLRNAFGGFHILLVRNLWRQWLSYVSMTNSGTYYFLNATLLTVLNGRHDPYIQTLCERFVETQTARGSMTIARFSSIQTFLAAFIRLHLYLYAHATLNADLLIYIDDLLADRDALHAVSKSIEDSTGIVLDLTDIKDFPKPWAGGSGNLAAALHGAVEEVAIAMGLGPEHRAVQFISRLATSCALEGGYQIPAGKKNV